MSITGNNTRRLRHCSLKLHHQTPPSAARPWCRPREPLRLWVGDVVTDAQQHPADDALAPAPLVTRLLVEAQLAVDPLDVVVRLTFPERDTHARNASHHASRQS